MMTENHDYHEFLYKLGCRPIRKWEDIVSILVESMKRITELELIVKSLSETIKERNEPDLFMAPITKTYYANLIKDSRGRLRLETVLDVEPSAVLLPVDCKFIKTISFEVEE